jgi:Rieske Fe-S protein
MTATPTRRAVLTATVTGAGAVGAAGLLSACGGTATPTAAPPADPGAAAPSAAPSAGDAPAAGRALATTADVPVGGGTVYADQDTVLTQPTAGEFRAFSATCTHQGCTVRDVADGRIHCPCHDSYFAIADGAVLAGPARRPLPAKEVAVDGDSIVVA